MSRLIPRVVLDHMERTTTDPAALAEIRRQRAAWGVMQQQEWRRNVPGSDVPIESIIVQVGADGWGLVGEALLAQLLVDAGWERTA